MVRGSGKFEVRLAGIDGGGNPDGLEVQQTVVSIAYSGSSLVGNEGQQKIAMTTPVFMSGSESNATMAFVMPARLSEGQVPKPSDASLKVRELPAGRVRGNAVSAADAMRKNEAASLSGWKRGWGRRFESVKSWPVYGYFRSTVDADFPPAQRGDAPHRLRDVIPG